MFSIRPSQRRARRAPSPLLAAVAMMTATSLLTATVTMPATAQMQMQTDSPPSPSAPSSSSPHSHAGHGSGSSDGSPSLRDSQVMEALDHASVQQRQWPQQPQQPQQPPQPPQQPQQPQQQQWHDQAALPVEVTGRQLAEEKKTPNGRKYCNTTQYGLKGDYAYEACGTFCKAEKATNQCAGRSAQSDCPPSAKRECSDRVSRPPPSVQLQVLQMPSVRVLQVDADAQQRGQEA